MVPTTLFLILIISTWCQANPPHKHPARNCTRPGPLCETCSNVIICIENSDGSWTKNLIGTCSGPEKCINATCSTDPEPVCDGTADLDFICTKVGVFPDPFFCNKFVMCIDRVGNGRLTSYVYECSNGYGFNAGTAACDVELGDGQCTPGKYPVPVCKYIGQSGPLEENPSIYYTCQEHSKAKNVLYPVLNKCPNGEIYSDYTCNEPTTSTSATTRVATTSESTTTTTVATTTTTTGTTIVEDEADDTSPVIVTTVL